MSWIRALISVAFALAVPAASMAAMQMTVANGVVEITGATPGGTVALLGTTRHSQTWLSERETVRYKLVDPDGNGSFFYAPVTSTASRQAQAQATAAGDPGRSLWIAVDMTTGEAVVEAPGAGEATPSDAVIRSDRSAGLWMLTVVEQNVDVMVVRPGVEAWSGRFTDGGPRDLSANSDRRVVFHYQELEPVALPGSPPGSSVIDRPQQGDVVVMIENEMLTYRILPIDGTR